MKQRIIALFLAVLLSVLALVSCGGADPTTTTPTPADPTPPPSGITLAKALVEAGFGVVGKDRVTDSVNLATATVINILKEVDKWISVNDDFFPAEDGAKEIIIGTTKRSASQALAQEVVANRVNSGRDWQIKITQDTVLIVGGSDLGLCDALAQFAVMLRADSAQYYPSYDSGIKQCVWPLTQLGNQPIQNYKIVLPAGASATEQEIATSLQGAVLASSGYTLPIIDDTQSAGTTELIIGQTSRPISTSALAALQASRPNHAQDGIVYAGNTQIALLGGTLSALGTTVDGFVLDFLTDATQGQLQNTHRSYQKEGMKQVHFGSHDAGEYRIVYEENAPFDIRYIAYMIQKLFFEQFGYDMEIVTDATPLTNGQKELLLGPTNRPASTSLALQTYQGQVDANGNAIFGSGHYVGVQKLYEAFLAELDAQSSASVLQVHLNYSGTVSDVALSWQADKDLTWDLERRKDANANVLQTPYSVTYRNETNLPNFDFTEYYELVWNDEFNGTAVNYEKWTHNHAIQMDDMKPQTEAPYVEQKDGYTYLTTDIMQTEPSYLYGTPYALCTFTTMNFSGGYLEMRGSVPFHGNGEFPSFWTTSAASVLFKEEYRKTHNDDLIFCGYNVEIDIFENFSTPDSICSNLLRWFSSETMANFGSTWSGMVGMGQISGEDPQVGKGQKTFYFEDSADGNAFHTYGFLWTDELMAFAVDGKFYFSCPIVDLVTGNDAWNAWNPTWTVQKEDSIYGEVGETYTFGTDGLKKENMALSVLFDCFMYTEGYQEKFNVDRQYIDHTLDETFFPLQYRLDYVRLYQCADDRIYTRNVFEDTSKLYDPSDWDYALRGIGAPHDP